MPMKVPKIAKLKKILIVLSFLVIRLQGFTKQTSNGCMANSWFQLQLTQSLETKQYKQKKNDSWSLHQFHKYLMNKQVHLVHCSSKDQYLPSFSLVLAKRPFSFLFSQKNGKICFFAFLLTIYGYLRKALAVVFTIGRKIKLLTSNCFSCNLLRNL